MLWIAWVYRDGVQWIPRSDHLFFMRERDRFVSDWSWFWHSVSYTRTRAMTGGSHYLFRPVCGAILGLNDIALRAFPEVLGALTLAVHAWVCWGAVPSVSHCGNAGYSVG